MIYQSYSLSNGRYGSLVVNTNTLASTVQADYYGGTVPLNVTVMIEYTDGHSTGFSHGSGQYNNDMTQLNKYFINYVPTGSNYRYQVTMFVNNSTEVATTGWFYR